ncbi:ZIP family metal transporter [Bacillus marinisedimentorum]|uniref:ZIP family metal transporter n=1 Tax=Bacillus marinisedimentorum TaxID=1821260 RepID=UPI0008724B6F|nr:ZIP family metal transporter [Bacillus marinisedimentorum]
MISWLEGLAPIYQALLGTLFSWGLTALGAALVFVKKEMNQKFLDGMLGFAAGVMIAASFWSLLAPGIEMAEKSGVPAWIPAAVGFLAGGGFLALTNKFMPHLHPYNLMGIPEGINPDKKRRSTLLFLAVTLHNIPEGLAVGVAFGAAAMGDPSASVAGAAALALGIGIQNFPEGTAVAMPLRREGLSRTKSFMFGQFSAIVEPIAAVIGVIAVSFVEPLLPYALSFAAGAMIFVVAEEVIPGSQENGNKDFAAMMVMIGFTVMMILDVALG